MTTGASSTCGICGKAAHVHVCEIQNGVKTDRSFCLDHAPAELRDKLPYGPHRSPADEVAHLRKLLLRCEQQISDPARLAKAKSEIEKLIADVEAGRGRIGEGA